MSNREKRGSISRVCAARPIGQTVSAYCRQAGISASTYYYRRMHGFTPPQSTPAPAKSLTASSFVEVGLGPGVHFSSYGFRFEHSGVLLTIPPGFRREEVAELISLARSSDAAKSIC